MSIIVHYATNSTFKKEEISLLMRSTEMDEKPISELIDLRFSSVNTNEPLSCDLVDMVKYKAVTAYRSIRSPCIVEHAGLILDGFAEQSYPGGLTQPMWDALGADRFVQSIAWNGHNAIAQAIVGYCDGLNVHTFIGETKGKIVAPARGNRDFYWDTIFAPDGGNDLTYAEIAADNDGLAKKLKLSQSAKAMADLFGHLLENPQTFFQS